MQLSQVSPVFERIEEEIGRVFVGQDDVLNSVLVAMLARGHVLLEGVPGVGKTLLVRTLGRVLGCHFRRVQFTPDLMPSDVTGSTLYNSQKGTFEFKHGPVFTHILLADEVNRAPAKTQSAMLESMAERSVTVDGVTHPLPDPYFVLATQNPLESAGTYALPEAQLDRFLFKTLIMHPSQEVEERLLRNVRDGFDAADLDAANLQRIVSVEQFRAMQSAVESVRVDDKIIHYIAELVGHTRRHRAVQIGASPRAAIALLKTGRVEAAVQGRDFVIPDDVKSHGKAVLRHRLILQPDAEIEGMTTDEVIDAVLRETPVPGMGQQASPHHSPARPSAPARPALGAPAKGSAPAQGPAPHQDLSVPRENPRPPPWTPARPPHQSAASTGAMPPSPPPAAGPSPTGRPPVGPGRPALRPTAPSGPTPSGPTPSGPTPSGPARSGPARTAPPPSGPARPAGPAAGSSPARPAGLDPNTLPPPTRGPFGNRGGQS